MPTSSNSEKQRCPRRIESPNPLAYGGEHALPDDWERRHGADGPRACSYCGSLHPDDFMAAVRDGLAELGPTDKSYKVYVVIQSILYTPRQYRLVDGVETDIKEYAPAPAHLKFYFQHLNVDQRREFVDLYNERPRRQYSSEDMTFEVVEEGTSKVNVGYPGYFYQLPFFMGKGE